MSRPLPLDVELVSPADPAAMQLVREQMRELMETWHQRVVTDAEVNAELGPQPTADLARLALAWRNGSAVGCGGLRVLDSIGELTKVYVLPAARGTGVGDAVVAALEAFARGLGVRQMRLDTRADLPAPAQLYRRLGYREVAPWHDGPFADHFFIKEL